MPDDWQVVFYKDKDGQEPVKDFLIKENLKTRAEISRVIKLLQKYNVTLVMPYVKKVDKSGLRELRIKHSSDSYRIFFFANVGKTFVLLHAFKKKTDKIPKGHMDIALKRMDDFIVKYNSA